MTQGHQSKTRADDRRTHPIEDCPRCGQNHGEVEFHRIEEPITGLGGEYPWWWLCETTKAPVLAQLSWEEC